MNDPKKIILAKTKAFLVEYKQLEQKKRKLLRRFLEEIHTLGDENTIGEIDDMIKDL